MRRSVPQSELIAARAGFEPGDRWKRLSFLDLVGEPGTPIYRLETGYADGATVVAVWPESPKDVLGVKVMLWTPDAPTLERLHDVQLDWPPALCDLQVRRTPAGVVEVFPRPTCYARAARRSDSEIAVRVAGLLDRGARALAAAQ